MIAAKLFLARMFLKLLLKNKSSLVINVTKYFFLPFFHFRDDLLTSTVSGSAVRPTTCNVRRREFVRLHAFTIACNHENVLFAKMSKEEPEPAVSTAFINFFRWSSDNLLTMSGDKACRVEKRETRETAKLQNYTPLPYCHIAPTL